MSKPPSSDRAAAVPPDAAGPRWLYRLFHEPTSRWYPACHNFLSVMIFVAVLGSALQTVDALSEKYAAIFHGCEIVVTAVFTLEYIGHFTTTRRPWRYVFSFWGIIDLMAILPTFFQVANVTALKSARMLRVLRVLRVMRVLKLARETVESGVRDEMRRSPLRLNLVIYCLAMFSVVVISSTLEYYAEYTNGDVTSVQRTGAGTLRFTAPTLPESAPTEKIAIAGGSPFDGLWAVKSWNEKENSFEITVPDAAIAARAGTTPAALADGFRWARDTPFTSVPQAMWWCMVTLTTVGYGDMYPVTVGGRIVAAGTMLCGLVLFGMLMNIVGKAMMVALFGTDQIDDPAPAAPAIGWDPNWNHCPTCGKPVAGHAHDEAAQLVSPP
jgi:hypothetical protein